MMCSFSIDRQESGNSIISPPANTIFPGIGKKTRFLLVAMPRAIPWLAVRPQKL